MEEGVGIYEKLREIQQKLKAPKNQFNSFGKYHYRSCEDILEAVKPLLSDTALYIHDDVVTVGERYYVRANVVFTNGKDTITATAYAREELDKKGMDGSQITGTASSYARKYALNGLFLIDDTKDADTNENKKQTEQPPLSKGPTPNTEPDVPDFTPPKGPEPIQAIQKKTLGGLMKAKGMSGADQKSFFEFTMDKDLTKDKAQKFIIGFDTAYETWQRAIKGELV